MSQLLTTKMGTKKQLPLEFEGLSQLEIYSAWEPEQNKDFRAAVIKRCEITGNQFYHYLHNPETIPAHTKELWDIMFENKID